MFNINKHSLLILMAMLILLIIPMSFAADVSEENNATIQASDVDDVGIDDVDNVEETLSIDDSDKLSDGYDYESVPNETEVNYLLGKDYSISLSVSYSGELKYDEYVYAYINGNNNPIGIKSTSGNSVYAPSKNPNINIKSFSDNLHVGENSVIFHIRDSYLASNNLVNNHFVPIKIIVELPPTVYYVDSSVTSGGDGSEGSTYDTLGAAIGAANLNFLDKGSIIIKEGTNGVYDVSSTIAISNNMVISAEDGADVTITSSNSGSLFSQTSKADITLSDLIFKDMQITSGAIFYQNGNAVDGSTLIVQNCNFINNQAPSLVRLYKTKATFKHDNFIENTLTNDGSQGGLVNFYEGGGSRWSPSPYTFDVSYCNIIGNVINADGIFTSQSPWQGLTANNNYWGSNYASKPTGVYNKENTTDGYDNKLLTLNNWVNLNTNIVHEVTVGQTYPIAIDFKLNDGFALGDNMPDLDISLSAAGTISPSSVTIYSNTAEASYIPSKLGEDNILVKYDSNILSTNEVISTESSFVYVSTPTVNGQSSIEYLVNDHADLVVTVDCNKLDQFESYDKLYAWIGGDYKAINTMANEASATIDLKMLSDGFRFEEGQTYTIYFHPDIDTLNEIGIQEKNCLFNPLTVKIIGTYTPEPTVVYTSTPMAGDKTSINYTMGSDTTVTVNVDYNDSYSNNAGFSGKSMRMFINGDTAGIVLSDVDANAKSFTVNLADYITEEGDYTIYFSPGDSILSWVFYGVDNHIIELNNLTVHANNVPTPVIEYLYNITPIPSSVVDYEGKSKIISVTANYSSYGKNQLSSRSMYIYINGKVVGSLNNVKADETSFTFDLADYFTYLEMGKVNNISIHPNLLGLDTAFNNRENNHELYNINNLTVTLSDKISVIKYSSSPYPYQVEYVKNDSCIISVSVIGDSISTLTGGSMYMYVNGDPVELIGIDSDVTSFTVDLADYDSYFVDSTTYSIVFHPAADLFGHNGAPRLDECEFDSVFVTVKDGSLEPVPTYVSTPSPDRTVYTIGESLEISVDVEYDDYFEDSMEMYKMFVYINGEEIVNRVEVSGVTADAKSFKFNLKDISDKLVVGENSLTFHPHTGALEGTFAGPYTFNVLSVTAKKPVVSEYDYESIPNETVVDYVLGESKQITVNIVSEYLSDFVDSGRNSVYAWINGESSNNRFLFNGIKGTDSSFTFDLADLSSKLNEGENTITFHIDSSYIEDVTWSSNYKFNTLTVNAQHPEVVGPFYAISISPDNIDEYINGTSQVIEVTASYDESKASGFGARPMYIYINGVEVQIADILADNTNFRIDLADYSEYLVEGETNIISIHPQLQALKTVFQTTDDSNFEIGNLAVNVVAPIVLPYYGIIYVDVEGDNDNDGSFDSPVSSIAKAIELASSENNTEHKIIIREGTYTENNLNITSGLDISGEGKAIIDAQQLGRILNINTADSVNISGITFKNGKANNGGAIDIKDAKVTISNAKFESNTGSSWGSAIYWNANDGKLINTIFDDNTGRNGVVAFGDYSNLEVEKCVFNNNHNVLYGNCIGLDIQGSDVIIKNTNFTNNNGEVGSEHGALYIKGSNVVVDNCLFENNLMGNTAAALQIDDGKNVTIKNSKFINNTAKSTGAIVVRSAAIITGNTFISNSGDKGGAIMIDCTVSNRDIVISENNFVRNTASRGAAIYVDGGADNRVHFKSLTIENNIFDSNNAEKGAGVYATGSDRPIGIKNNEFTDNIADKGSAVYADYTTVNINGNEITNNKGDGDIYSDFATINTNLRLTFIAPTETYVDKAITITASLVDDMGNTVSGFEVKFTTNGDEIGSADLSDGIATLEFTPTEAIEYIISGSIDDVSPEVINTTINPILVIDIDIPKMSGTAGNNLNINVTVKANGEDVDNKTVSVSFNGKTFDVNVVNGIAKVPITLPDEVGVYNLTVSYRGEEKTQAITVNEMPPVPVTKTDYSTTVVPNHVNYVIGESLNVTVNTEYNSSFADDLGEISLNIYINDGEGIDIGVKANVTSFTFDLANIMDNLTIGINDIYFGVDAGDIIDVNIFNKLTVNAANPPEPIVESNYTTTPSVSSIEYIIGENKVISVNIDYDNRFTNVLGELPVYAFIKDKNIKLDDVHANDNGFEVDLKTISKYLTVGKNIITLGPIEEDLTNVISNVVITYNTLTVNAKNPPVVSEYDYESTPNETYVDYVSGENKEITVSVVSEYLDRFEKCFVYVWINGESTNDRYLINHIKGSEASFTFDLADIDYKLNEGINTITFHIDPSYITEETMDNNYKFHNLTVNRVNEVTGQFYAISISPNNIDGYTNGTSQIIEVTASYDEPKASNLSEKSMYIYINGVEVQIADILADSTNFRIDLADYSEYLVEGETNIISIHPQLQALKTVFQTTDDSSFKIGSLAVNVVPPIVPPYYGIIYVDVEGDNGNDGSFDSPVSSIAKAIELASSENNTEHKIIIREGTYTENNLNITSGLDISGEGKVVIDAQQLGRILNINTADSVNISGITFENGKSSNGGAINIKDAKVTISNAKFINNTASSYGAAIFWDANDGTLTNTSFENNVGRSGIVALGAYSKSTKKYTGANTEIENCTFNNNHNTEYGNCIGLDVSGSHVHIKNTRFTNNIGESGSEHGALYIKGDDVIVENCLFENNSMSLAAAIQIDGKNALIQNSKFINNTASKGAGIYIVDSDGSTVKHNEFIGNTANQGSAIYAKSSTVALEANIMDKNEGDGDIYSDGAEFDADLTLTFTAPSEAYVDEAINITASLVDDMGNTVSGYEVKFIANGDEIGSASLVDGIAAIEFAPSEAIEYIISGLIDASHEVVTTSINPILVIDIDIPSVSGTAGNNLNINVAVKANGKNVDNKTVSVSFNGKTFDVKVVNGIAKVLITLPDEAGSYDLAVSYGDEKKTQTVKVNEIPPEPVNTGVIYVDVDGNDNNDGSYNSPISSIAKAIELASSENNTEHKIIIREGTYAEFDLNINAALDIAGEGNVIIDAQELGGILNINTADSVNISGITFANGNSDNGGAINIIDAKVTIDNAKFINNTASSFGSAILWDANDGKLTNTLFENNTGRNGAVALGIYDWYNKKSTGANTEIENCTFNNNHNVIYGNCIGLDVSGSNVTIKNTNFTNNIGEAGSEHGALYIKGDDVVVDNCLFENNSMGMAAAIQIDGKNALIENSTFINNTAIRGLFTRSGAIEVQNTATIIGNTFIANGGDECRQGGAIDIVYNEYGGEIIISDNEFINNTASNGAAIYVDGGSEDGCLFDSVTIENNIFDSNNAEKGAGVYTATSDRPIDIINNKFNNNIANEGSAIYADKTTVILEGNTMNNNEGDGDIYSNAGEIETDLTLKFTVPLETYVDKAINITASLVDDMGNAVSGYEVKFTVNGDEIGHENLIDGMATMEFTPTEAIEYSISGSSDSYSKVISAIISPILNAIIEIKEMSVSGEDAIVPITVKENGENVDNKTVSVSFNGKTSEVTLLNGTANVLITLPNQAGNYNLTVSYKGKEQTKVISIDNDFKTVSIITVISIDNNKITGVLKDSNGKTIANAKIKYIIDGTSANVLTKQDGTFTFEAPLDTTVQIVFEGDNETFAYNTSIKLKDVNSVRLGSQFNVSEGQSIETFAVDYPAGEKGINFQFKLTDTDGNPIANASVQFAYKTSIFNRTTDENGIVVLGVSTQFADSYLCALSYLGDETHNATFVAFNFKLNKKPITISAKAKTFKKSTKTKKYTITLKTSKCASRDGKIYLKSGKKVTLKINGKTYSAKTNKKGQATFKIKLNKKGKYTATIKFAGNKTYKSASKKVKITIK